MASNEKDWVEGPLIRFAEQDLVQLLYLGAAGKQLFEVAVDPTAEVVEVQGALDDQDQTYFLSRSPKAPAAEQQEVPRILLIGDMHGQFAKLKRFLRANDVIDDNSNWCWGKGQLVMCGDVMDRGLEVLPLLWFLCRMEQQAAAAGGALHVLLGNHELMVMQGDYRYVNPRLLRLYASAGKSYGEVFGPDWYLGQWLRSRNAVVKLNRLLISHAGISPAVAREQLPLPVLNQQIRSAIDKAALTGKDKLLLSDQGPLWFRAYILNNAYYRPAGVQEADEVLAQYEANHLVVAHTTVPNIQPRLEGRVWAIDLDIESHRVEVQGLLFEQQESFVLKADGSKTDLPSQ